MILLNAAFYDKHGAISINSGRGEGSFIGDGGNTKVKTVTLDEVTEDKAVGYIKMDVEGSEYAALRGAEQTIKTQKPLLAISIYHKRSDIWEIPQLVLQFNGDYKFYLRHYTVSYGDTVLYAVP